MFDMKRFLMVFLAILLLTIPVALAEAVDAVPEDQLLTKEALATMGGMVLVTAILTQGIKMLLMQASSTHAIRIMAFIVAAAVTVVAKLIFGLPFEVADILILPGNALLVWWASMKGYEQILGSPSTPAGNAENKNIH